LSQLGKSGGASGLKFMLDLCCCLRITWNLEALEIIAFFLKKLHKEDIQELNSLSPNPWQGSSVAPLTDG
jgi:hypothetical protein